MKKKVVFFGSYDPNYSRNILTKKAFLGIGWEVVDCNDRSRGLGHHLRLIKEFLKCQGNANIIFIAVLGYYDVPLAWVLGKIFRKKIILDAFYPLYETYIEDRKILASGSLGAKRLYLYDWIAVRLSDKVLLDTQEHIRYFINKYKSRKEKFFELPVTADPQVFRFNPPKKQMSATVGFYGSFMPLHGVDVIVRAAKLLKKEKIKFYLAGDGPELKKIESIVKKLSIKNKVFFSEKQIAYNKLPIFIKGLDLFLAGPFGKSTKAKRIVTAKTAEALSIGIPVVISRNKATQRLLKDYEGEVIWLNKNSARELANEIKKFFGKTKQKNLKDIFSMSDLSFTNFQKKIKKIVTTL